MVTSTRRLRGYQQVAFAMRCDLEIDDFLSDRAKQLAYLLGAPQ
jgi:hypothetical protein